MKIYIAGPLHTEGERILLEKIDVICKELGFETYLPHRDGQLLAKDRSNLKQIFERDCEGVDKCSIVIAVLNGFDVDSGTSWEMGCAFSKEKPIIGYINHILISDPQKQLNPMILGSLNHLAGSLDELKQILSKFKSQ